MGSGNRQLFTLSGTSPASESTAALSGYLGQGLTRFNWFTIHANLVGATDGTLDVVIQRQIASTSEVSGGIWSDWIAFAQLAAGASAVQYVTDVAPNSAITAVGGGTDSTPTKVLAAGTVLGGHPGERCRVVCAAGASTSAGAALTFYMVAHRIRS